MTPKTKDFLAANAEHGVISKRFNPAEGVVYKLANGRTFSLTRDEAEDAGFPRWEGIGNA